MDRIENTALISLTLMVLFLLFPHATVSFVSNDAQRKMLPSLGDASQLQLLRLPEVYMVQIPPASFTFSAVTLSRGLPEIHPLSSPLNAL